MVVGAGAKRCGSDDLAHAAVAVALPTHRCAYMSAGMYASTMGHTAVRVGLGDMPFIRSAVPKMPQPVSYSSSQGALLAFATSVRVADVPCVASHRAPRQ